MRYDLISKLRCDMTTVYKIHILACLNALDFINWVLWWRQHFQSITWCDCMEKKTVMWHPLHATDAANRWIWHLCLLKCDITWLVSMTSLTMLPYKCYLKCLNITQTTCDMWSSKPPLFKLLNWKCKVKIVQLWMSPWPVLITTPAIRTLRVVRYPCP